MPTVAKRLPSSWPRGPRPSDSYYGLYNNRRWRELRATHLEQFPYCVECQRLGRPLQRCMGKRMAVDHIRPHKGNPDVFYDPSNLQTLCNSCHSRKTCREDGGFGNRPREKGDRE